MKLAKISIGNVTNIDFIEISPINGRLDMNNAGKSCILKASNIPEMYNHEIELIRLLPCQMGPR